jgi:DNA-binding NtrC family response regulator
MHCNTCFKTDKKTSKYCTRKCSDESKKFVECFDEKNLIQELLKTEVTITKLAEYFGITRQALGLKIKRYGISSEDRNIDSTAYLCPEMISKIQNVLIKK